MHMHKKKTKSKPKQLGPPSGENPGLADLPKLLPPTIGYADEQMKQKLLHGKKVSEIVGNFVKPFAEEYPVDDRANVSLIYELAMEAWNYTLLEPQLARELLRLYEPAFRMPDVGETLRELFGEMVERKLQDFEEYRFSIDEFKLTWSDDGEQIFLRVMASVSRNEIL